jgi:hypothetical protein
MTSAVFVNEERMSFNLIVATLPVKANKTRGRGEIGSFSAKNGSVLNAIAVLGRDCFCSIGAIKAGGDIVTFMAEDEGRGGGATAGNGSAAIWGDFCGAGATRAFSFSVNPHGSMSNGSSTGGVVLPGWMTGLGSGFGLGVGEGVS